MEMSPYTSQGYGVLVVPSDTSRRDVFRRIAQRSHVDWPAYDSTPLYDQSSLTALTEDIRTVSGIWFEHSAHNSAEGFVCQYPLSYVEFNPHDQSTLWRSWNKRFSADFREAVERTARTILINAQNAGVAISRDPERKLQYHNDESSATDPDEQTVLEEAAKITDHVSRVVFPAFSLTVARAVRYTRTPTGTYRCISDSVRDWLRTKGLAVSYINPLGIGPHWDTPITNTSVTSRLNSFERCTGRPSLGS